MENPVAIDDDARLLLLEKSFTEDQIVALRAYGALSGSRDNADAGTGVKNYRDIKAAFGRLMEAPTNWHQGVYADARAIGCVDFCHSCGLISAGCSYGIRALDDGRGG